MEGRGPHPLTVANPRAYFDENYAGKALVEGLRARGVDVTRAVDEGTEGWSDEEQLTFAASRGFVLVTTDEEDFLRLHAAWMRTGRSHAGIIAFPQTRFSLGEVMRRLARIFESTTADEFVDRVEFLSNWD